MKNTLKACQILLALVLLLPLLSACTPVNKLRELDNKAGELISDLEEGGYLHDQRSAEELSAYIESAQPGLRKKIDAWLEVNNYNRYGDPLKTMYEKGSPLIDSISGADVNRYEYILKNIPDILQKVGEVEKLGVEMQETIKKAESIVNTTKQE